MSWFNNLGMKVKLIGGFSVAALITAIVAAFGISTLKSTDNANTRLYEVAVVPAAYLQEANTSFLTVRIQLRQVILARSPEQARRAETRIEEAYAALDSNVAALGRAFATEASVNGDSIRAFVSQVGTAMVDYKVIAIQIMDLAKVGRSVESVELMNSPRIVAITAAVDAAIAGVEAQYGELGKAISEANTVAANRASTILLVILAIGVILCVLLGLFISTVIAKPLAQAVEMIKEMGVGRLGRRLRLGRKDEIGVLTDTMDLFAENLQTSVLGTMKKIAAGDLSTDVKLEDAKDEIAPALQGVTLALRGLVAEAGTLSKAAVEGKLATRGDATKYQGAYRDIVKGVNDCLDAVIGPLNVAAEYVDRISKGDIPPKITDNYNGDFNEIKNNLNVCIDALNGLVNEMNTMSKEHNAGDIDVKIPVEKFQGSYQVMAGGVNDMVFGHIAVKKKAMACLKEFGQGNFDAPLEKFPGKKAFINDTFEQVRGNLKALIADADMLGKAAVEGKLATRADATKHQGDFRKIVQGVNNTLDAVIGPLNVAAEYVDRISKGDIPPKITDNYNGDFNEIKNNLNVCIDALNGLVNEMNTMSKEHDATRSWPGASTTWSSATSRSRRRPWPA
jgi:methyl-accepting chemotaxis protein